jgi:hypothetical protein
LKIYEATATGGFLIAGFPLRGAADLHYIYKTNQPGNRKFL